MIDYSVFDKVDIRTGTVINVSEFPQARKPAYKLEIDFGEEIGIKKSSAQITKHYDKKDLLQKQVIAVVNLKPRQIGPFVSEVLVLGVLDECGDVVLVSSEKKVANGMRIH